MDYFLQQVAPFFEVVVYTHEVGTVRQLIFHGMWLVNNTESTFTAFRQLHHSGTAWIPKAV